MPKRKTTQTRRSTMRRRRMSRSARTFTNARKAYPSSDYGYRFVPRDEQSYARYGPTYSLGAPNQRAARESDHYYGKGKYGFLKKAWKFSKPYLKQAAVYGAKRYIGAGIYTGQGSYDSDANGVISNELVGSSNSAMIPRFADSGDETGTLSITHREYVGEIYANEPSSGFENRSFPLNPGIEETFPWLSQLAANYEEYDFEQLMFSFRSTVADVSSANGQVGTVIMATNYNPSSRAFRDKGQMLEYSAAASAKSTETIIHGVECDDSKLSGSHDKYVRTTKLSSTEDLKEYDHGTFQIATANTPAEFNNNSIGELWVSYTVKLRKPKLFTGRGNAISRCMLLGNLATGMVESLNDIDGDHRRLFGESVANETGPPSYLALATKSTFKPKITQKDEGTLITLPGNLSGVWKIKIQVKMELNTNPAQASIGLSPPLLCGNIVPWYGVVGGGKAHPSGSDTAENPSWYLRSYARAGLTLATTGFTHLEFYVRLSPASNNVDNALYWGGSINTLAPATATSYYTGQGAGAGLVLNTDALAWEDGLANNNQSPLATVKLNSILFVMEEHGSSWEQDQVEYPEFENYLTGRAVTV